MFGYKLIKKVEIENLKVELANAKADVKRYETRIAELEKTIDEKDATILRLSDANVKDEPVEENPEKPVKKVRRRSSKKNIKKEE
jgi:predicted kinase